MIRWVCNVTMLFTEVPLLERFERAARAGFRYVEFLFPYGQDVDAIARELEKHHLEQVLFNLPAGRWESGERGIAADPSRREEFAEGVRQAVAIAQRLGVRRLNCLAGRLLPGVPYADQHACLVDNLRRAADHLARHGIMLLVEPLNDRDVPGFLLTSTRQAVALLDEVGRPNVKVQYDAYHMQIMEGNLTQTLKAYLPRIGHVQIADVPGRHQPGTGEIRYPFVLQALDEAGYDGWVSLEYVPQGSTEESLRQAAEAGLAALGLPHEG
ncbi:MAG: hydroxypyruvate isomerase [Limnochordaceae bacterium]|nr:hydroxypyruvate isomerase [Limnochordaceae bacterium]